MNILLVALFLIFIITACILLIFALAELFKNAPIEYYPLPGRNKISWSSGGDGFILQELKVDDSGVVIDERCFTTVYGNSWLSFPDCEYCFNSKDLKSVFKRMEWECGSYLKMMVAVENNPSCKIYKVGDVYRGNNNSYHTNKQ